MTSTLLKSALLSLLAVMALCESASVPASVPAITPEEEAEYIALDVTDGLLADRTLFPDIMKNVAAIRKQFPIVANVRNYGNWILGSVLLKTFDTKSESTLSSSKFGPIQKFDVANDKKSVIVQFTKPYQPVKLADAINKEFELNAQAIWKNYPDYGDITFDPKASTYTFRQGLENCGPDCNENHFWVFKIDNATISIEQEYATSIPRPAS